LDFGLEAITFERLELDTSNLAQARDPRREHGGITKIDKNPNPRWPPAAILDFGLEAITFDRLELDTSKIGTGLEIREGNMAESPKLTKIKIQDVRRPPSRLSVQRP